MADMKLYELRRKDGTIDPDTHTPDQLAQLAANGNLDQDDAVRVTGKPKWYPIKTIPNLLEIILNHKPSEAAADIPASASQERPIGVIPDASVQQFSEHSNPISNPQINSAVNTNARYQYKVTTITPSVSEGDLKKGVAGRKIQEQVEGALESMTRLGFELHSQAWIDVNIKPGCALLNSKSDSMRCLMFVFRKAV
tara:strand:- start:280 stop:867 length:588 start_codon:yes stop_codon:yes gene_type:complete